MMKNNYLRFLLFALCAFCWQLGSATEYYVATTGNDNNPGTAESPFATPNKAVEVVKPGDKIIIKGGRYMLPATIKLKAQHSGTANARIYMWGAPGEQVILDGKNIPANSVQEFKMSRCIYLNHEANYWHFKNLEMCNANDNGMKLEGSYNIVENCKFYDNNDTGLQIGMYKDFTYEDTKTLPAGSPQFNPGYQFCKYNIIINCDSYYNYDSRAYGGGKDDGGDADGFACKLFPGPGTEFHGCRAWQNSDDNWDLYMVYHPIIIDNCWSWKAGYDKNSTGIGNGNGFKLGGGGTSGGAAFAQSIGAHVVKNCIAFDCLHKGFDQNNAYEGMYLFNNVSFHNEYNYRFPTVFMYGQMHMRNNIGFKAKTENHEFLSADKPGSYNPDTDYNSWTTIDKSSPYKESTKVGKTANLTQEYSSQFKSLSSTDFMATRQTDGSLPDNNFGKLTDNSIFIDKGQKIENYEPKTGLTANEMPAGYQQIGNITIPYNGTAPDFGAFESGDPTIATLVLMSGTPTQNVYTGTPIEIVYKFGGAATDANVTGAPAGFVTKNGKTVTISGNATTSFTYSITNVGGTNLITLNGAISVSNVQPATLTVTSGKASQEVNIGSAIQTTVYTWGGGATDITWTALPAGLEYDKNISAKTLTISGIPTADGTYSVTTAGGMEGSTQTISATITRVIPVKVLTGDWYHIQDAFDSLPDDLEERVAVANGSGETIWNPTRTEDGNPFSTGSVDLGKSGGYIMFTLPSLVELKINMFTTGDRTLQIKYGSPSQPESTWKTTSIASFKKGSFPQWDVMSKGGISETKEPIAVKIINTASGGGLRINDFYIKVFDDGSVVVPGNKKPEVQLTKPEAGNIFEAPANIKLSAMATDEDGSVSKVEFYNGAILITTVTEPTNGEYSFLWENVAKGTYSVTAKVFDNEGVSKTSSAVVISVTSNELDTDRLYTLPYILDFNPGNSTFTQLSELPSFMIPNGSNTIYNPNYANYSKEGTPLANGSQAIRIEQNESMTFRLGSCKTFTFKWCSSGKRYPILKDQDGKEYLKYSSQKTAATTYTETATINATADVDLTLSFNGSGGVTIMYLEISGNSTSIKNVNADKGDVVDIKYYTITGAQVSNPQQGIFIKKTIYSSGMVETTKVMK